MKKIEILGPGCAKCQKLADTAKKAVEELGAECELEKVTDLNRILGYGVMLTPALVVDGRVMVSGRVPSVEEIKTLLRQ